jgi:hypothetical protein
MRGEPPSSDHHRRKRSFMSIVLTIVGIAVILVGLWDIFHTLLHPRGQGPLSGLVLSAVWKASKGVRRRLGSAVGPAAMVAVILNWVGLQIVGWALIYYPRLPDGFGYSSEVSPAAYSNVMEALYVSMVTLATLGYGDVVATDPWVRMTTPLEGLAGFALLTAAMTWFSQIYPPLARRRVLALELTGLAEVGYAEQIGVISPATLCRVLDTLASGIATVRVDLTQHSECFYFLEQNLGQSLAHQLPCAIELRDAARSRQEAEVRLSAQRLSAAVDELTRKLKDDFGLPGKSSTEVIASYAAEHEQGARR